MDRFRALSAPALVAGALLLLHPAPAAAGARDDGALPRPRYAVRAALDLEHRTIAGTVLVRWTNTSDAALDRLLLDLYPNRFSADGDEVNDVTRAAAYPRLDFDAGGIDIEAVTRANAADAAAPGTSPGGAREGALAFRLADPPGLPAATALEVSLAAPLAPGEEVALEIAFTTRVPERYGPFGASEGALAAIAGWHPYAARIGRDGAWELGTEPEPSDFAAEITAPSDVALVIGSEAFPPGHATAVQAQATSVRTFAVIAFAEARISVEERDATRFTFVAPAPRREQRLAPGPPPAEVLRAAVEAAVARRPEGVAAPREIEVVQIPLRWNLSTPADGLVVVSDRAMHVQELLRGFHEAQVAQAVYAQLLRERVFACEAPGDRQWVLQAVAWALADRFVRLEHPTHRDVHWWIDWLDLFAIVDRFELAPKVPFVQSFFPNAESEDDLRENVFTWGRRAAPARLALARLARRFGAATVVRAVDDYVAAPASDAPHCKTFAGALTQASGQLPAEVEAKTAAALAPPPAGTRAIVDPELRPARERPPWQFVLDTADVEVSSSEIGLAALFVLRRTHDYTKDFALNPYYTERSYGFHAGPRLHFGAPVDPVTYRHNLFGFYTLAGLDSGFKDDRKPGLRQSGHVSGFGLRYDYSNVYFYDNPTAQREAHGFVDWLDPALGSDYGFVRFGLRASATTPLWTHRTIGAVELLAGFEEPTSDRGVPIQEQFSLGGRRALRGVSVNARLARNIGLARFELRQDVFPEWNLDLLDLLTYRRPQLQLFLDTGQVDDSAGRALDPEHWALAAGVGFNALYDFLGFFPGRAYIEVATRLDREQTDVQVLFGTRQAF